MSYNLSDDSNEAVEVILNDKKYNLRLPTVEEVEDLGKIKDEQKLMDQMYGFVETTEEGQTPFQDEIRKSSIRVIRKFGDMIKKEFGIEE